MLALLLGETLSGLYSLNDVAEVGPLTPYVPARVANWIDAAHSTLWNILLAAVALHCRRSRLTPSRKAKIC